MSPRPLTAPAGVALVALLLTGGGCGKAPSRAVEVARGIPYSETGELDVYRPGGSSDLPVIVTLHGCCGSREDLSQLAFGLAEDGAVVFNASWRGTEGAAAGHPGAYDDASCAVRFARAEASAYGGDPRRVTLVGWSDGALVAGVTANAGDDFTHGCRVDGARALPEAFVGLGGFLGWSTVGDGGIDAAYVNERTIRYFGGLPHDVPAAWAGGNPYTHLGRNRALQIRLVVGGEDPLMVDSECFLRAARAAGHPVSLSVADGAGHQTIIAPRTPEGALAVREILAAARGEAPPATEVTLAEATPCPGAARSR